MVDNDLGLNDSEGQHSLSGCDHSRAAKLREYKEEDEDEHVFIEILPSLKENRKAEYRQGSVPSLEAAPTTESYKVCLRAYLKVAPTTMADRDAVLFHTQNIYYHAWFIDTREECKTDYQTSRPTT